MRIIPSNTNVETQLFKGVGFIDALVGFCGIAIGILAFLSNMKSRFIISIVFFVITTLLLLDVDGEKSYMLFYNIIKYLVRPKIYVKNMSNIDKKIKDNVSLISDITPFTMIDDNVIEYAGKYVAAVIEIPSIEFKFFTERKQDFIIDKVIGAIIRTVNGKQSASFVKIDRPVLYDHYLNVEIEKIENIKKSFKNGLINETELKERIKIINTRISDIERLNKEEKVIRPFHYLVFYEKDRMILEESIKSAVTQLNENDLHVRRLKTKELVIFLKYNYDYDFDEREVDKIEASEYIDWIMPDKIEFASRTTMFDDKIFYNFKISGYPALVGNAWGHTLFNVPNTKVIMKIRPVEKYKAVKAIDRSIDELRSQQMKTSKTSKIIDLSTQANSLAKLLVLLNNDNETLYDVSIFVSVYDNIQSEELKKLDELRKENTNNDPKKNKKITPKISSKTTIKKYVKRLLSEGDFKTSELLLQQFEAYAGSQVSGYDPFARRGQKMPSGSAAAVFPFVYPGWLDPNGFNLGQKDGAPVFLDFFVRDSSRVNSNMVIIGKSGSGKSFSTKTILTNLASDDTKIFVLDPENEYQAIAKKMHGKMIDVGSATQGRLNPFHIITSLTDEEETEKDTQNVSFSVHLQFLEEFFKQILPGINSDAKEYLNNILIKTYEEKGINTETNLSELSASDFPTFDDVYETVLSDFQTATGEYSKNNLRVLLNYVSKFATGGRNSNLWNGESTITTNENFIVFNFQSLLANKNNTIANAQMLLVLKWLDNEIIKNRDYNIKYKASRRIIVVIDEAHVFIDEKFPIALDFMFQLAKRIRKYSGMQIIITQNIKDFVGTEELARKSTAIINACQYSFIFPLAPNDMGDLCKLYEKAGAINATEQEQIVNNGRGNAFVVLTPTNRTNIKIIAPEGIKDLFE